MKEVESRLNMLIYRYKFDRTAEERVSGRERRETQARSGARCKECNANFKQMMICAPSFFKGRIPARCISSCESRGYLPHSVVVCKPSSPHTILIVVDAVEDLLFEGGQGLG